MSAFDDYLNAPTAAPAQQSFDAYLGAPVASAPAAAPVANTVSQAAPNQPQDQWQPPNSFVMGAGDIVKGGVQDIVGGLSWLANKVAPESQFAKDAAAAIPQMRQTVSDQEQQYQAARQAAQPPTLSGLITGQRQTLGIDWGRLTGQAAAGLPLAAVFPAGRGVLGTIGAGALSGAASGALQPVGASDSSFGDEKLSQLGTGALTGGIAAPIAGLAGKAVQGVTNPIRQRLAQAGVTMTPGQILGGAWQRTEDRLTSAPVLGDFIKNAQQRSVQSFNRAAYDSALDPIGQTVPKSVGTGSDAVDYVRKQIGNVYDSIEPRASFVADQNFGNDVATIRADLAQNAPGALNQFDNIVQNQVTNKLQQGFVLDGSQWGNTRSTIAGIARNQRLGNATPDNRVLADALDSLNDAINAGVGRASPPDVLQDLTRANAAYAQYKQIERAAGMAGASNNGNVFTAAQYANAVRRGATNAQKATNAGLNGQLASDATDVLGSKYPDSGTAGRSLLALGLGAAAGHVAAPAAVVPAAAGIGLGSLPYTTYGQRLAQALLLSRPAGAVPVGNALLRYGIPLAPALGVPLVNGVANAKN